MINEAKINTILIENKALKSLVDEMRSELEANKHQLSRTLGQLEKYKNKEIKQDK